VLIFEVPLHTWASLSKPVVGRLLSTTREGCPLPIDGLTAEAEDLANILVGFLNSLPLYIKMLEAEKLRVAPFPDPFPQPVSLTFFFCTNVECESHAVVPGTHAWTKRMARIALNFLAGIAQPTGSRSGSSTLVRISRTASGGLHVRHSHKDPVATRNAAAAQNTHARAVAAMSFGINLGPVSAIRFAASRTLQSRHLRVVPMDSNIYQKNKIRR
jgi:hypothetical protein